MASHAARLASSLVKPRASHGAQFWSAWAPAPHSASPDSICDRHSNNSAWRRVRQMPPSVTSSPRDARWSEAQASWTLRSALALKLAVSPEARFSQELHRSQKLYCGWFRARPTLRLWAADKCRWSPRARRLPLQDAACGSTKTGLIYAALFWSHSRVRPMVCSAAQLSATRSPQSSSRHRYWLVLKRHPIRALAVAGRWIGIQRRSAINKLLASTRHAY